MKLQLIGAAIIPVVLIFKPASAASEQVPTTGAPARNSQPNAAQPSKPGTKPDSASTAKPSSDASNDDYESSQELEGSVSKPRNSITDQAGKRAIEKPLFIWLGIIATLLINLAASGIVFWLLRKRMSRIEIRFSEFATKLKTNENQLKIIQQQIPDNLDSLLTNSKLRDEKFGENAFNRTNKPPESSDRAKFGTSDPQKFTSPIPQLSDILEQMRATVAQQIGNPGLRTDDYDASLAQFGTLWGVEVSADGQSARFIHSTSDTNRRLIGVVLSQVDAVAIVPSSRFAKDFTMTYKEILDAGSDVKLIFNCRSDGTGSLRINRVATGMVDSSMVLSNIKVGELTGFVG